MPGKQNNQNQKSKATNFGKLWQPWSKDGNQYQKSKATNFG